jgi:hypothetical protein
MAQNNPEKSSGGDRQRPSERSEPGGQSERTTPSRSSTEQESTAPPPLFAPPWRQFGWYALGAIPATMVYMFIIGVFGFLSETPGAVLTPFGIVVGLLATGCVLGFAVAIGRWPRFVMYEALTALCLFCTASTVVPDVTSIPGYLLGGMGLFWVVPGALAVGWALSLRWLRPHWAALRQWVRR